MVVAIMGLMAGTFTPLALHLIGTKKAFASRDELQALKKAIIGDPLATQWGSEATFGYIGDMGGRPTDLQDLYTRPANAPFYDPRGVLTFDPATGLPLTVSTLGIGSGWRGPYVAEKSYSSSGESLLDPYKNAYIYDTIITPDATLGAEVRATIRSYGPNRSPNSDGGTQDDLTERILTTEVLADVAGIVKDSSGAAIPYLPMTINYPVNGTMTSLPYTTGDGLTDGLDTDTSPDPVGYFSFNDIPLGERSITLSPVLVYVPGTAYATYSCIPELTSPEDCNDGIDNDGDGLIDCNDPNCYGGNVSFQVANLSSGIVTITSIKATYNIVPTTTYALVKIDSNLVAGPSTFSSGVATGLTSSQTFAASTMQREPFRFLLQSSRVEIPDIKLNVIGAGSTKTIELQGFTNAVAGVFFTVEFSNGSKITFTPQRR